MAQAKKDPAASAPVGVRINSALRAAGLVRPIDSVVPDPRNARKHGKANLADIETSLREHGQVTPIVLAPDGKTILKGNGTWTMMKRLGATEIAAVPFDEAAKKQQRAYAIRDNRSAEKAEWNVPVLLDELALIGEEPGLLGFDESDLLRLADEPASGTVATPTGQDQQEPTVRSGHLVEIQVPRETLPKLLATLEEWGKLPGVVVNVT